MGPIWTADSWGIQKPRPGYFELLSPAEIRGHGNSVCRRHSVSDPNLRKKTRIQGVVIRRRTRARRFQPVCRGVWAASLRAVPKGGTGLPACRSTQGGAGLRSNLSFDYRPIEVRRCPRTLFKPAAFRRSKLRLYRIQLRRNRSVHARLFSRTFGLQSVVTMV